MASPEATTSSSTGVTAQAEEASKPFRDAFGHTPLSVEEKSPWKCQRLVIGTGAQGGLLLMWEVEREADRRGVELVTVPTQEAITILNHGRKKTNAIIHVTC